MLQFHPMDEEVRKHLRLYGSATLIDDVLWDISMP